MKLVSTKTGLEVKVGDTVKGTAGLDQSRDYVVRDFHRRGHTTTPDRVVVWDEVAGEMAWLPNVFDLRIED
ncbi:MAG TPA: hypothetical protein VIP46_02780 [Pyrinomonadaceae bacterium]